MPVISFNEESVSEIKAVADIVEIVGEHVDLKKAGVNYKGLCPFHSEKTPSFTVTPAKGIFHCFGCSEGGDVLAFVMRFNNIGFPEAVKQLAERYNIALPEKQLSAKELAQAKRKQTLYAINEKAADIYHRALLNEPMAAPARNYLKKRGIPQEIIKKFKLGFAPDRWEFVSKKLKEYKEEEIQEAGLIIPSNRGGYYDRFRNRVLFPIIDINGRYLGFGGRILGDGQPKYLNTSETPIFNKSRTLFGLFQNKEEIRKRKKCLVVEGNFDLIALNAKGIPHVTAPLGTALTAQHVRALKGYVTEAVLFFDGDRAGLQAAMRSVPLFLSEQLPAKVAVLPNGHDPDTYIKENGKEGVEELLQGAASLPEFVFEHLVEKHGLSLEGKAEIVKELQPIVSAIGERGMQRTLFVAHFSQKLGLTPEQMTSSMPLAKKKEPPPPPPMEPPPFAEKRFSKIEEQLLGFLITSPEHLGGFLEAGLEHTVSSPPGRNIVARMREISESGVGMEPELLLDGMQGIERRFIADRMMEIAPLADEAREAEAQEKMTWLKENVVRVKMKHLTEQINRAQQANDQEQLMELLKEKTKFQQLE